MPGAGLCLSASQPHASHLVRVRAWVRARARAGARARARAMARARARARARDLRLVAQVQPRDERDEVVAALARLLRPG